MTRSVRALFVAAALLAPACGDDETPFSPSVETVSGSYAATSLTATAGGITVNLLQLGGSLTLVLNQDGTTTGRLFAPGLGVNGEDIDQDLAGTWTLDGSTVTFDHPGNTFIRDVPFTAERDRLRAESIFEGATIRATLTKTV
jgi:hypothetical protein